MATSSPLRHAAVTAVAVFLLGIAGCADSSSAPGDGETSDDSTYFSPAGYDESQLADFRAALEEWNARGQTWRLASLARGTTRCGLGFDAAFPSLVLMTVINTDGRWFQVSIDPGVGVKPETVRNGSDYTLAFGEQSPEDFFALAEPCEVADDGTVSLSAGG